MLLFSQELVQWLQEYIICLNLLDELQGKTMVTTILFYPGALDGTTGLRFMDLKGREALGNYRVKIYG